MAQTTQDPKAAHRQERRDAVAREVDERSRQTATGNERMSQSQPTPTQRENDLAKVGALNLDEKEDDGSGPDQRTRQMTPAAAPTYATRAASSAPAAEKK